MHNSKFKYIICLSAAVFALIVIDYVLSEHFLSLRMEHYARILVASLAMGAVGVLSVLAFAYRTRKRLRSFADKLRLIAAADYTVRSDGGAIDEFGDLGRALDLMVDSLSSARDSLVDKTNIDSITGLFNHRCFQERLAIEYNRAARYNSPLSLLIIDIDHFKQFNDINGYPTGDYALREIASVIAGQVRDVDIAARYGGEEFAILLPETTAAQAQILGERIREAASNLVFEKASQQCRKVTVSVGVGEYPENCSDRAGLLRAAEEALYQAKMRGRNIVAKVNTCQSIAFDRPYQCKLDVASVQSELERLFGKQLDPAVVSALIDTLTEQLRTAA